MEKGVSSYYYVAVDDLNFAKGGYDWTVANKVSSFNNVACLCAQACEKLFKAVLETYDLNNPDCVNLLKSHNLRKLLLRVKEIFPNCNFSVKDYKYVGDFYFEARYPGPDYIVVDQDTALECLNLTFLLKEWVDSLDTPGNEVRLFD